MLIEPNLAQTEKWPGLPRTFIDDVKMLQFHPSLFVLAAFHVLLHLFQRNAGRGRGSPDFAIDHFSFVVDGIPTPVPRHVVVEYGWCLALDPFPA